MSAARKACGRPVKGTRDGPCWYPRAKGLQRCHWHWLLAQSSDVQASYAKRRLYDWRASYATPEEATAAHRGRVPASEWPEGERWCVGCQTMVPLFYTTGSRCKACNSMAGHEKRLETTYGIDAAEYERIFAAQGRRCGICGNRPRTIRFAVDHNHKTGEVRGILCKRCNHDLLGGGHDSIDVLWQAMVYLIHPPALRAPGWKPPTDLTLDVLGRHLAAKEAQAQLLAPRPPQSLADDPAPF